MKLEDFRRDETVNGIKPGRVVRVVTARPASPNAVSIHSCKPRRGVPLGSLLIAGIILTAMGESSPAMMSSVMPWLNEAVALRREHTVHTARTLMLAELSSLLAACPSGATANEYFKAITEDNVLDKATRTSRLETAKRLRSLYALDRAYAPFRVMHDLWDEDTPGQPLLALLCAASRDPVLRLSAAAVLPLTVGTEATGESVVRIVSAAYPSRYGEKTLAAIGRNCLSSWTQSGHLTSRQRQKFRVRVQPTPGSVTLAIVLGQLSGVSGIGLLDTFWMRLLDARPTDAYEYLMDAARRGWLSYVRAGDVVHIAASARWLA